MDKSSFTVAALFALSACLIYTTSTAGAESRKVTCPIVVDRTTGKFTSSKTKYACYSDDRAARRAGYKKHSFSSDSCNPSNDDSYTGSGLSLTGPGEKRSVVFTAPTGGSIDYSFPGGGQFEIKVMSASSDSRLERILETSQASSGNLTFSARNTAIYIKVEGPGAWTAQITVN